MAALVASAASWRYRGYVAEQRAVAAWEHAGGEVWLDTEPCGYRVAPWYGGKSGNVFMITGVKGVTQASEIDPELLRPLRSARNVLFYEHPFDDDSLRVLECFERLEHFSASRTRVNGSMLAFLPTARLRELQLQECPLQDEALRNLARFHALEELDCWGTPLTDEGGQFLACLKQLRYVDLGNTRIGDSTCQVLARLSHLQTANVADTLATDQGVAAICRSPSLRVMGLTSGTDWHLTFDAIAASARITQLFLSGPVSARSLAKVFSTPSIRSLRLNDAEFDPSAIRPTWVSPSLTEVTLPDSDAFRELGDELHAQDPHLDVEYYP